MLTLRLEHGDCREILPTLPEQSVQCVVTSPPYFGLRDYGTAQWDGGDPTCDHGDAYRAKRQAGRQSSVDGGTPGSLRDKPITACRCGARRIDNQIGLEPTPDAYVAALVGVFREVRRALRDDGVCWLNLGDSYWSNTATQGRNESKSSISTLSKHGANGRSPSLDAQCGTTYRRISDLKPKDLIGIPWRVAFALQADGWYLRQDIIWAKNNPMPESVRDRCTKSHEYIFLLSKRERYFWDADAIREDNSEDMIRRAAAGHTRGPNGKVDASRQDAESLRGPQSMAIVANGRNRRSVWTVNTQPYAGAHFAVMPEALVEPCVLAGSRPGDVILDPFAGSGTVCRVALRLGRSAIGIDLNGDYLDLAEERTNVAPLFVERPC